MTAHHMCSRRFNRRKHRTVSPPEREVVSKSCSVECKREIPPRDSKNKNVFQVQPCVSTTCGQSFVLQRDGSELAAYGYRIRCVASCGVAVECRVVGATAHAVRDEDSGESCSLTLAARCVCQSWASARMRFNLWSRGCHMCSRKQSTNQTKRRYQDLRFNVHWDNTSVVA